MSSLSRRARLHAVRSRLTSRLSLLALLAGTLLVLAGIVALVLGETRLALAFVLLLQALVILGLVGQRESSAAAERRFAARVDQSSARTLADLSRVRQQVLMAIDETRVKD